MKYLPSKAEQNKNKSKNQKKKSEGYSLFDSIVTS
jgi:hypothetical protein